MRCPHTESICLPPSRPSPATAGEGELFVTLSRRSRAAAGEGELIVCARAVRSADGCREAQFMAVRIADVKVAFAPRCIGRRTIRSEMLRERVTIESIDVVDVENDPA